ncbi:hypothetical protein ACFMBG_10775 [Leisingera sp. D0M16]|uniref:hypothetical protein n=1 Tax=Leisingera coralii TaxID=3351347 RepID=UPI003B803949
MASKRKLAFMQSILGNSIRYATSSFTGTCQFMPASQNPFPGNCAAVANAAKDVPPVKKATAARHFPGQAQNAFRNRRKIANGMAKIQNYRRISGASSFSLDW